MVVFISIEAQQSLVTSLFTWEIYQIMRGNISAQITGDSTELLLWGRGIYDLSVPIEPCFDVIKRSFFGFTV